MALIQQNNTFRFGCYEISEVEKTWILIKTFNGIEF